MAASRAFLPGLIIGLQVLLISACTAKLKGPDLGGMYNRAAKYHQPDRNPIIVIPGILGSKLINPADHAVVWGAFGGRGINPQSPEGARLLALPLQEGQPLKALQDEVVSNGVLDKIKVRLLGMPLELKAYFRILATLGTGGYRDQSLGELAEMDYGENHYTCFQFDYDWRRDNVESAQRLHEFILEKKRYVRAEIKKRYGVDKTDIKFDIVAHSMGGLLTRYFLRYGNRDLPPDGSVPKLSWAGAEHVERVIMVGTPNAGSVKAFQQLIEGTKMAPLFPRYEAALLGSFPSIYQLLPRTRHQPVIDGKTGKAVPDILDPALWQGRGWGLADPDQAKVLAWLLPGVSDPKARRRIALEHQNKTLRRAAQFSAALDRPAKPPEGLELYLIAGDAVATPRQATIGADRKITISQEGPGDETVLRSSALMDERLDGHWQPVLRSPIHWSGVIFLFSDHLGLTQDPGFADNVLYWLLEDPRTAQRNMPH